MTPSEILLAAARHLREHGWRQGPKPEPPDNVLEAIRRAGRVEIDSTHLNATYFAAERLRKLVGKLSITEWNDAPGRTVEEALAVLEEAAKMQ